MDEDTDLKSAACKSVMGSIPFLSANLMLDFFDNDIKKGSYIVYAGTRGGMQVGKVLDIRKKKSWSEVEFDEVKVIGYKNTNPGWCRTYNGMMVIYSEQVPLEIRNWFTENKLCKELGD